MVKKSVVGVLCAVCALSASAEEYYGECKVLIANIRSTTAQKKSGIPITGIYTNLDRLMASTRIGRDATEDERRTWRRLIGYQYDRPEAVTNDLIAREVGRFCRDYPYRMTFEQAVHDTYSSPSR